MISFCLHLYFTR